MHQKALAFYFRNKEIIFVFFKDYYHIVGAIRRIGQMVKLNLV